MTRAVLLFVFVLAFPLAKGANNNQSAAYWLEQMNHALSDLNYEGHFVYMHGNSLEGMKISHHRDEDGLKAKLLSLNGAHREVIRDRGRLSIIRHQAGKLKISQRTLESGFTPFRNIDPKLIESNYEIFTKGRERVAGRMGRVILVNPKDSLRYGYRLVLDMATALPLEVVLLDESRELVSQIMFTDLAVSDEKPSQSSAQTENPAVSVASQEQVQRRKINLQKGSEEGPWKFTTLPAGYQLKTYRKRPAKGRRVESDHYVFSDGLATMSLYVEPVGRRKHLEGNTSLGSVNAAGKTLDNHHLTAVGEVPVATLEILLKSITVADD
ncbi:MAG: MucB/RseB C-terminal domain-containing protein [bacterium]